MTTYTLPATVETYFALIDSDTRDKAIDAFSDDAQVTDDGKTSHGRADVLAWLNGAASEWETVTTVLSASITDQVTRVTARITGNFPGGEVDLTHEFVLDADGLISRLTISV